MKNEGEERAMMVALERVEAREGVVRRVGRGVEQLVGHLVASLVHERPLRVAQHVPDPDVVEVVQVPGEREKEREREA